jgi:hypothetical protein
MHEMSQSNALTHSQWTPNSIGFYLKPEHTTHLRDSLSKIDGTILLAKKIDDGEMSASIISKLKAKKASILSAYGEYPQADGSLIVKHPAIGYITIESEVCDEPRRLFASRVKSLSSNMIRIYGADAQAQANGSVSYINRRLLLEMEMSQIAFSQLLANPGRNHYPGTIRSKNSETVIQVPDMNEIRMSLMFNEAQRMTSRLDEWADELLSGIVSAIEKGGVMSKRDRTDMAKNAQILSVWTEKNPAFYAERLAEFSDETTTDIKLEVMFLAQIKG